MSQPAPEPRTPVYEALRKSNERLHLLAEIAGSLLLTDDPRELLRGIFNQLSAHFGLEVYLNYMMADSVPRLRLDSSAGVPAEVARELEWLELGQTVCGAVASGQRRIVCEDVQRSPDELQNHIRALGITAYACFPLAARGRLIGTLSFGSRLRATFDPDELDLLQTIASQVAVAIDRKRAFEELRRSSADLRERAHILDFAHVFIRDMDSTIVFWNRGAEGMYGYSREEALGRSSHELLRTEFPQPRSEIEARALREGSWEGELVHVRRDNTRLVVASHWVLHRDEQGRPAAILEVNNDITQLREAEAALRESEFRYRMLSEAVPVMVFTGLPDGRWDYANQRWFDYTGFTAAQTYNYGWTSAVHPDDLPEVTAAWKHAVDTNAAFEAQFRLRRADGMYRWFLGRGLRLRDGGTGAGYLKWFGTCMDVEDHKRVEEAVRRAQKSEGIAVLAGGIAHQFNNLLTGILGGVSFVMDSIPQDDPSREILEGVMSSGQRAADLTGQLLAYAGKGRFVVERLDISALVHSLTNLLETAIPKKVSLRLELGANLPNVEADAGQLRQLVMSLVMNAAEAIGTNSGTVRVCTGTERVEKRLTGQVVTDELPPGTYVCLEVEDTGCGMDEVTLNRIFDPFFTTKFMGRGLGLAAVLGIVRGHKGAIRIRSAPGQGSTFTVLLPAAAPRRERVAPARELPIAARTILVVDDEDVVRRTARTILERFGYRVLLAENGRDAISMFEKSVNQISLVVLDMAMPVMSGEEALPHLKKIRPDIPVVVASGYDETEASRRFAGQEIVGFIQKPYTSRQLAEKIRTVLDG